MIQEFTINSQNLQAYLNYFSRPVVHLLFQQLFFNLDKNSGVGMTLLSSFACVWISKPTPFDPLGNRCFCQKKFSIRTNETNY